MPSLQIRDVPEDIYQRYKQRCAEEGRSMAQQTLLLIKQYLASEPNDESPAASRTEAMAIASPHTSLRVEPQRTSWENSIYNPMVDIIGREERIAKRKALFKRIDERAHDYSDLPSAVDLIREDRDNDLGRTWVKEFLNGSSGL